MSSSKRFLREFSRPIGWSLFGWFILNFIIWLIRSAGPKETVTQATDGLLDLGQVFGTLLLATVAFTYQMYWRYQRRIDNVEECYGETIKTLEALNGCVKNRAVSKFALTYVQDFILESKKTISGIISGTDDILWECRYLDIDPPGPDGVRSARRQRVTRMCTHLIDDDLDHFFATETLSPLEMGEADRDFRAQVIRKLSDDTDAMRLLILPLDKLLAAMAAEKELEDFLRWHSSPASFVSGRRTREMALRILAVRPDSNGGYARQLRAYSTPAIKFLDFAIYGAHDVFAQDSHRVQLFDNLEMECQRDIEAYVNWFIKVWGGGTTEGFRQPEISILPGEPPIGFVSGDIVTMGDVRTLLGEIGERLGLVSAADVRKLLDPVALRLGINDDGDLRLLLGDAAALIEFARP